MKDLGDVRTRFLTIKQEVFGFLTQKCGSKRSQMFSSSFLQMVRDLLEAAANLTSGILPVSSEPI